MTGLEKYQQRQERLRKAYRKARLASNRQLPWFSRNCCFVPPKAPPVPMPPKKPDLRKRDVRIREKPIDVMASFLMQNLRWKQLTGKAKGETR